MTGRQSPLVKTARLLQRVPQGWLRPMEKPFLQSRTDQASPCTVFLLALPRSGSTLTYQALIHALEPVYLSNLWNMLYGVPWIGGQFSRVRCTNHESDFRSSQGFVEGLCGPAEGLRFWSYWTGCGLDETAMPIIPRDQLENRAGYLRRAMAALTTPEAPMVSGYLGHALIAQQLRRWFPEAVFLRLHRDPLSNAASILRSRKAGSGAWFSVFPEECTEIVGNGIHAEVAAQVYWLNRRLAELNDDEQTIHVDYGTLCRDPDSALRTVIESCNAQGLGLTIKKALPEAFEYRMASPEDDDDTAKLAQELERLETEFGPLPRRYVAQ